MLMKEYPKIEIEEFQAYKCKSCGKECILGENCCDNKSPRVIPGKKIIRKKYIAKPDYFDCLSELRRSGKMDNMWMETH